MKYKKNKIHNYLLRASADTIFLKKIIKFNGILDLKNNELDFFSFICKTIISQQISFKVANKIWEKITLINQNKNENFLTFFEKKKTERNFSIKEYQIKNFYLLYQFLRL